MNRNYRRDADHFRKTRSVHAILEQLDLDAWMIFVRESSQAGEPALELVYQGSFTWQSALIITRRGDRLAVVGQLDDGAVRGATGDWTEIVPYVQSVCEPLRGRADTSESSYPGAETTRSATTRQMA